MMDDMLNDLLRGRRRHIKWRVAAREQAAGADGKAKKTKKKAAGGRSAFIQEVDEESSAAVAEADAAAAARKVARKEPGPVCERARAELQAHRGIHAQDSRAAYLVYKYGELALGFPREPNGIAAAFVFLIPPYLVAKAFLDDSKDLQAKLPSL